MMGLCLRLDLLQTPLTEVMHGQRGRAHWRLDLIPLASASLQRFESSRLESRVSRPFDLLDCRSRSRGCGSRRF